MSHDFKFIPQYKGKDLVKITKGNLKDRYFAGLKFDGHYTQVHKFGDEVMFFTSGGKPFKLDDVEAYLVENNPKLNFIVETEHIGLTEGKLGARGKCTTTTWFTNFDKNIPCSAGLKHFKCFDLLHLSYNDISDYVIYNCKLHQERDTFKMRQNYFTQYKIDLGENITLVQFDEMTLQEAKDFSKSTCKSGWEGVFCFHETHTWYETNTARSNLAIKIKKRLTADLLCIGTNLGEDKYEGLIGSLILQDLAGRVVSVGSGMSDQDRHYHEDFFIGKAVEVFYEQILDTYIQPTFGSEYEGVLIRDDKNIREID